MKVYKVYCINCGSECLHTYEYICIDICKPKSWNQWYHWLANKSRHHVRLNKDIPIVRIF